MVSPNCIKCADNCFSCSVPNECNVCNSGFLLHKTLKTCGKTCSANCRIPTDTTISPCRDNGFMMCDSCDVGYGFKSPTVAP